MGDATITRDLPALKWRGMLAPAYDVLPFKWRNRLAGRPYYGVDGEAHDPTGRGPFEGLSARLYFVNTLLPQLSSGLGRLYPDYWEQWRDNGLLDGDAGDLEHPVLGPIRARLAEVDGVLETRVQSGIIVTVSWVATVEDPSTITALGNLAVDPSTLAANADALAGAFGIIPGPDVLPVMFETSFGLSFPDGFSPPTLLALFASIQAPLFNLDLSALGQLDALIGLVVAMVWELEDLSDNDAWQAIDACIAFWSALRTMRANLARAARKIKQAVVSKDTYLDAFALEHGNSVAEIMALNSAAVRTPLVKRGTALQYYVHN